MSEQRDEIGDMSVAELRTLVTTKPDARGECDDCHCWSEALYADGAPGDWLTCKPCIRRIIKGRIRRNTPRPMRRGLTEEVGAI